MAAPGSVRHTLDRLKSWCLRAPKGLARVEFESELSRRAVVDGLRLSLPHQNVSFSEMELPSGKDAGPLARDMINQLRSLGPGVVSISGFEDALLNSVPSAEAAKQSRSDAASPANALRVLNFHRESLALPGVRQIWWMTPKFAELFVRAVPDLDSWFMVRLRLEEVVPAPTGTQGLIEDRGGGGSGIEDARRRARALVNRFRNGIDSGEPEESLEREYALPALFALQQAGAYEDVVELAASLGQSLRGAVATRSPQGPTFDESRSNVGTGDSPGSSEKPDFLAVARDYEAAAGFYRRAVENLEKELGPGHPDVAMGLSNLAEFYRDLGRRMEEALRAAVASRATEAVRAAGRATEIYRRLAARNPDAFEPDLATSLDNLAIHYRDLGRREEAAAAARQAADIRQRLVGRGGGTAPDSITISITAKTMEGLAAVDPEVTVDIIEVTPLSRPVLRTTIPNFDTTATLNIASPEGFPTWQVNLAFSRFDVVSGFFFQPRSNTPQNYQMRVVRLPNKWKPQFTPLSALSSPRFDPFRKVLAVSNSVDLKNGPPVGDLGQDYDTLTNGAQVLAKTALLNLFAVLSDEQDPESSPAVPWFSYVRKIVRIDQERFIAEVDPGLFEDVQTILRKLNSTYKAQGYFTESPALHTANIPPQYDIEHNLMMPMITVKKKYEQGNVQLNLSVLKTPGGVVHLLDCDMDEHANIIEQGFDLVKHLINGGTSPIAMHEYIVEHAAQQANGIATIDLGYRLI